MQSVFDYIKTIVERVCQQESVELVDIVMKGKHPSRVIQIFIDRVAGVTLEDCTRISRLLSDTFDVELPDMDAYRLEVSSPGLDRPLKSQADFLRNEGRRVAIELKPGQTLKRIKGDIVKANENFVCIDTNKDCVEVEYASIKLAKIQIKF